MKKEERPAWLETLWNVNPSLAERAEKDLDNLSSKITKMTEDIQLLTSFEKCPNCHGLGIIRDGEFSEDCSECGGCGYV